MEQSQNKKTISALVVIVLVLLLGYFLYSKYRASNEGVTPTAISEQPRKVEVENTATVNGVLPAPAGLPSDIPLEGGAMLESVTTKYPEQNAEQLSLNYHSSKSVADKYAEYKAYMQKAGYEVMEGDASSPVRALFGEKEDANLTVVVSSSDGGTLVQLAYLIK